MKKSKINIISLGCAKNLVDSEILTGGLKKSNMELTSDPEEAETIIVNTCGFLDQAREESVDVILQAAELKKSGNVKQLIVMGCLSERYPNQLKKELPEVDRFFGTNDHRQIVSFITGKPHSKDDPMFWRSLLTPRHYAYVKIAEGCDNGCSFCSIPIMRGLQTSRPISSIVDESKRLVGNGVKELLVIAQDSTSYGWDLEQKVYLSDLIKELNKIDDPLNWIRIHYAHPAHLSQRIIDAMAESDKVCKYLDIPIQHASDRILTSMRRGLGRDGILDRINRLKDAMPDIRLRTTVIVGYPGETEEDFGELYSFLEETQFDRLGIFTYSEEEDTPSEKLNDNVQRAVKDERKAILTDLHHDISADKNSQFEGKAVKVIVDEIGDNMGIGRTEYDSPEVDNIVRINGKCDVGKFYTIRITESNAYELIGEIVP